MATGIAAQTPAPAPAAPPREVWQLTAADFAQLPFMADAELSPSGEYIAGELGIQGQQLVGIMPLFDKAAKPTLLRLPEGTEARWVRWVNDDNILVGLNALLTVTAGERWYVSRILAVNRTTGKQTKLGWDMGGQQADLIWIPSDGSNEVLIAAQNSIYVGEEFWPKVYRFDVTNGRKRTVVDGRADIFDWNADATGSVRTGWGYVDSTRTSRLIYRGEGETGFRTIDRANSRKDESTISPLVYLPGTNNALVVRENARGKDAIFEVDLLTQADVKEFYAAPGDANVERVVLAADGASVLGVTTSDSKGAVRWLDPALAEMQAAFDKAVPDRRARIISYSRDRSRLLVRIDRPDTPGAIYFFDTANPKLQRLALVNEGVGSRPLNPVKTVKYKARDGLEIEAILTLPKHRPATRLPVVVMPHGGPWAQDTEDYDYWAQFVASRGYAVIQPNFRGSTGYGEAFLKAGEGQLGLKMQDDVTDALAWAAAEGIADPKRACIMGASYGGYAAMWGIAREPDLYRCSIAISGVASLRREVNDFGSNIMAGKFRDDWKAMTPDFAAVSPLNAVDRIKAPLLLIHGKKDVTVDVSHSESMNSRMRGAGKDVEFLPLPEADHYFTRQADREALLGAVERFLARHNPAN